MRSHRNARPVPSRLALALCALLAGASLPAWAVDPECKDQDGNPLEQPWVMAATLDGEVVDDGGACDPDLRIGDTFADVTPVPEPGSLGLLATGFAAFTLALRRRRKQTAAI